MTCRTQTMSVSLKFYSQQCCQARSLFLTLGPSSPSPPFALLAVRGFRDCPVPQPNTAAQPRARTAASQKHHMGGCGGPGQDLADLAPKRTSSLGTAGPARRPIRGRGAPARAWPNQATRVRPFGPQTGILAASRATPCGYPPSSW